MRRLVQVLCMLALTACHDKVICPAFQSTYILDDSTRNAFFSYVWQLDETTRASYLGYASPTYQDDSDSLGLLYLDETAVRIEEDSASNLGKPQVDYYAYAEEKVVPWRVRGRTKYGIVKYEPNWLRRYRMRTAPMENVFAPKPPKDELKKDEPTDSLATDSLAAPSLDSTALAIRDSVYVAEALANWENEKEEVRFLYNYDPEDDFNVEQEYYNKHFGERLVDKRPLAPPFPLDSLGNPILPEVGVDTDESKESFFDGIKNFFSNLFAKKDDSDTTSFDSTEVIPLEEEPLEEEPSDDSGNE